MITNNKTDKDKNQNIQLQDYKILEWDEMQFRANLTTILTFGSSKEHIQKIITEYGDKVYLVPEKFYMEANSMFRRIAREEESLKENNKTKTTKEQK